MHLRVVAQRFKMADALHGGFDRFLINDAALAEGDRHAEAVKKHRLQHFALYVAHQPHLDFAEPFVPNDAQHRILRFERAQILQHRVYVRARRQQNAVGQNRFEHRQPGVLRFAQSVARAGKGDAGDGADRAGFGCLERRKLFAGIQPDGADFFAVGVSGAFRYIAHV